MNAYFINFTNHPSSSWSKEQIKAVREKYDSEIIDVSFPPVSASADESEIKEQAMKDMRLCSGSSYVPGRIRSDISCGQYVEEERDSSCIQLF